MMRGSQGLADSSAFTTVSVSIMWNASFGPTSPAGSGLRAQGSGQRHA